jgi:hypothetical protein
MTIQDYGFKSNPEAIILGNKRETFSKITKNTASSQVAQLVAVGLVVQLYLKRDQIFIMMKQLIMREFLFLVTRTTRILITAMDCLMDHTLL